MGWAYEYLKSKSKPDVNDRCPNPLRYHNRYDNIHVEVKTAKAYLITFNNGEQCWVAKKLCKKLTDTSVYIWHKAKLNAINEPTVEIGEINV